MIGGLKKLKKKSGSFENFENHVYMPGQVLGGCKRLRPPEFPGNRHMKVVRLSTLRIGRLHPLPHPQNISLVLISVRG
jgi:hypothetical protein